MLVTKIALPILRMQVVHRPSLLARLNAGRHMPLTLLSASAGFGKTTLLCDWLAHYSSSVAWLSLDEEDNDPVRFWSYVIAALQTRQSGIGQAAGNMLSLPRTTELETVLTSLFNDLASLTEDITLVLDDYHLIEEQAIHTSLLFLLKHQPPCLHLLIASRIDPPIPLAQMRARGQLLELRDADLRFLQEETDKFLQKSMDLSLSASASKVLQERTEGWIAGLQLAALSLQGNKQPEQFIQTFSGSHRFILDYLVDEVLQKQSAQIQHFLLATCILERMNAGICEELTGERNCQELLEQLERRNLFLVALDNERTWYRYHALFAETLQARLHIQRTEFLYVLHEKAMHWYEREGMRDEAIVQALAARLYDDAARLLEQTAEDLWQQGRLRTLLNWVKRLPEEIVRRHLVLSLNYAWCLLHFVGMEEALVLVAHVEEMLDREETKQEIPECGRLQGMIAVIRTTLEVRRKEGKEKSMHQAEQALELLPLDASSWRILASLTLAYIYQAQGIVERAHQLFVKMYELARARNNRYLALFAIIGRANVCGFLGQLRQQYKLSQEAQALLTELGGELPNAAYIPVSLGEVLYEWNELEEAHKQAQIAVEKARQQSTLDVFFYSFLLLSFIQLAEGDLSAAALSVQEAKVAVKRSQSALDQQMCDALEVELWLAQGNLVAAKTWAEGRESCLEYTYFQEIGNLALAHLFFVQERFNDTLQLLEKLIPVARLAGRIGRLIEMSVLQVMTLDRMHVTAEALEVLAEVLRLTQDEKFVRVYISGGERIVALLRLFLKQGRVSGISMNYVEVLLVACDNAQSRLHTAIPVHYEALVEPLSERELEVLRMLALGVSNQEIAVALVITLAMVKKHVGNVLAKLGVSSRTRAIVKARESGLL